MKEDEKETFYVPLSEAMIQAVKNKLGDKYAVKVDCPYAACVEFGTAPAHGASSSEKVADDGDMITEVNKKFRDWVAIKHGYSGKERKRVGDAVYKRVMKEGLAPRPFMRSTIYHMQQRYGTINYEEFLRSDEPYRAMATYMAMKMKQYLRYNQNIATHELYDSIRVVPADEMGHARNLFEDMQPEDMDPMATGRNGKRPKDGYGEGGN